MAISSSLVSAVLIAIVAFAVRFWKHTSLRDILPEDPKQRRFLHWFHKNDGWLDPHLGLTTAHSDDGFGSALTNHGEQVEKYYQILLVPERIQISKESAVQEFRRLAPDIDREIQIIIYEQLSQDETIALALQIESCLGEHSFFEPYLNVLPNETLPLLFSFDNTELELLQDEALAEQARETSARLHQVWSQMLEPIAGVLATRAMKQQGLSINDTTTAATSCLTQAAFNRFYAISASRSMILDGTKHLVPMADMINHHPRMDSKKDENFESFHNIEFVDGSASIAVHADRRTPGGGSQLFEEYGKLDNSLYLVAFGFVPIDNPYHCALLSSKHFPILNDPVLMGILQQVDPSWQTAGSVCVHRDGSVLEHVPYLAMYALDQSNGGDQVKAHRQNCIDSYTSGFDRQRIEQACIHQGLAALLDATTTNKIFESAARTALEMATTTLEQDLVVLARLEADSESGLDVQRKLLAVRFRIEEKRLTREIAGSPLSDQKIDL
jgi:hypothetical protein